MVAVMVLVLFTVWTLLGEDFGRRPSPPGSNRSLS